MKANESQRLDELRRYELFDGGRDGGLDRLVELAARVCQTPLALITFVGATYQQLMARWGEPNDFPPDPMPVEITFCRHALDAVGVLIAEDVTADARFASLPAVLEPPRVRFYAGAPLRTPLGYALGTVCVFDRVPRTLSPEQTRALAMVSDQVMQLFEMRRELLELRRSESLRQEAVEALMASARDLQARVELRTREVEEAHRKTRQLLERIGDAFVALDRDWNYVYVNARAAELFGRTNAAELIGQNIWDVFPEGRGQPFHLAYERAMQAQTQITLEALYEPWGRWFENRIYPSSDGIAIFFTEITERRRAEEALECSRARLIEAQRVAHVGSWEWNVARNQVAWSDELYRIYGVEVGSALDGYEGFLGRVHPDDMEATTKVIAAARTAGAQFAYDHRIVRADGRVRMLHTRGESIVVDGKVARLVGSCWDVTEYQTATQALKRTVALLEATLQVTSDGLLVIDGDGKVATFNDRFTSLFCVPAELASSHDSARLMAWLATRLAAPSAFGERVRALAAHEDSRDVVTLRDGRELEARSTPQRLDGELAGRVWSFRELKPADA